MCLTAHYIDENWKLIKRVISFQPITSHKGKDIGAAILNCLRDWGIENVMVVTIDNASANDTAIEYLRERLSDNLISGGKYIHMRCTAHILNLIVQDGLNRYKVAVERISDAVRYIRKSPIRIATFKACVKEKEIKSKAMLRVDCPTRWNSTFDMLKNATSLSEAFYLYELKDPHYKHDLEGHVPRRIDWMCVKNLTSLLEIFKRKTEKVSGSSYVVSNLFMSEVIDLNIHLLKLKNDSDIEYKVMGEHMRVKFNKYWEHLDKLNMFMYFAIVLDPCLKMDIVAFGFQQVYNMERHPSLHVEVDDEEILKMVKVVDDAMIKVFGQYKMMYQKPSTHENSKRKGNVEYEVDGENEFLDAFVKAIGGNVVETATEYQKYKNEPSEPKTRDFNILNWWKVNSPRFPILSNMAKDVLAILISTVASESAFSTGGRVLDDYMSCLSPTSVKALICTQDWIRKRKRNYTFDEDLDEL